MSKCECYNCGFKDVDEIIEQYKQKKINTIELLQKCQDINGYLPQKMLEYICLNSKIKESELYSIVTFYSQFSMTPRAKYNIEICLGTACYVKGADKILNEIKNILGVEEGEVTSDGKFRFNIARCLGCCSIAPVVKINDNIYGLLDTKKIAKILKDCE